MSNISLLPEQINFINSKKPIVIYAGGIGSGKTFISCIKAIQNALRNRTQLMIGLTYSSCRDVILATLSKVLDLMGLVQDKHYTINKSDFDIKFKNSGSIKIRSAEIGNKLRGLTVADIFIDEASYLKTDEVFQIVLGRAREVEDGQVYLTTSPCGFNWLYDLTQQPATETISISTFKNSFLPEQYIKNMLKQYSSAFIRQELYGEFVAMSSGIFKSDWIKDINSNPDLLKEYSSNCTKIRFWDFAFGTDKGADYSAGVLLGKCGNKFVIEDIVRVKKEWVDLRKTIVETAIKDGGDVVIGFERAGQQKSLISDLGSIPELNLFRKKNLTVSKYGSKIKRMLPMASLAENGNLYILNTCNNKREFLHECDALTMDDSHLHDDMIDSLASAFILFNEGINGPKSYNGDIF